MSFRPIIIRSEFRLTLLSLWRTLWRGRVLDVLPRPLDLRKSRRSVPGGVGRWFRMLPAPRESDFSGGCLPALPFSRHQVCKRKEKILMFELFLYVFNCLIFWKCDSNVCKMH